MGDFGILFCRPGPGSTMEDDFALEADVVDALDFETHVIDADFVVDGEPEHAVARLPLDAGALLYRGPILSAEEYEALSDALAERGATLVTEPSAYEHALYVPEHHEDIADLSDEQWDATYQTNIAAIFRISSLAALVAAALSPVWALLFGLPQAVALLLALAVLIFIRHRPNITRLLAGQEPKIGKK